MVSAQSLTPTRARGARATLPAGPPTGLRFSVRRTDTGLPAGQYSVSAGRSAECGSTVLGGGVGVEGALASVISGGSLLPQEEWKTQEFPVFSMTHHQLLWANSPSTGSAGLRFAFLSVTLSALPLGIVEGLELGQSVNALISALPCTGFGPWLSHLVSSSLTFFIYGMG